MIELAIMIPMTIEDEDQIWDELAAERDADDMEFISHEETWNRQTGGKLII